MESGLSVIELSLSSGPPDDEQPKNIIAVIEIIEAFRTGIKDMAEFWITMEGKFLHIRYFAVRDKAGVYRGTLEVMQDVTRIRSLEGERRLVNWEANA